jgi:hypothetical protein
MDDSDIRKHMKDVFKLAATLTGPVFTPRKSVKDDLQKFIDCFPEDSNDWHAITASMKEARMPELKPSDLMDALVQHFGLTAGR